MVPVPPPPASPRTSVVYRAGVRAALALAPLLARRPSWREGLRRRAGAAAALEDWARAHRDRSRPLLWMHAPSVGEGLQAEAVLRTLRPAHPEWQVVYTHTSPSAEALAARQPADVAGYLPWDRPAEIDRVLGALAPQAVVFSKLDLWPELATRAARRGADVAVIAATVSPVSSRLRWPARALLRAGYRAVTRAGAIDAEHADRLVRLGVSRDRIEITGDPRFDSALDRARRAPPADPAAARHTLVAGSTWEGDETVLLAAFALLWRSDPALRLLLVPHEPAEAHLARIERLAAGQGLPAPARSPTGDGSAPLVLVDRVGVLAGLYPRGAVAYVGGGFGRDGLHSVLEPAACGVPVLFGPSWQDSREAGLLLSAGAARVVGRDPRELADAWKGWIRDEAGRRAAGERALETVVRGCGAAERNAALVAALLASR